MPPAGACSPRGTMSGGPSAGSSARWSSHGCWRSRPRSASWSGPPRPAGRARGGGSERLPERVDEIRGDLHGPGRGPPSPGPRPARVAGRPGGACSAVPESGDARRPRGHHRLIDGRGHTVLRVQRGPRQRGPPCPSTIDTGRRWSRRSLTSWLRSSTTASVTPTPCTGPASRASASGSRHRAASSQSRAPRRRDAARRGHPEHDSGRRGRSTRHRCLVSPPVTNEMTECLLVLELGDGARLEGSARMYERSWLVDLPQQLVVHAAAPVVGRDESLANCPSTLAQVPRNPPSREPPRWVTLHVPSAAMTHVQTPLLLTAQPSLMPAARSSSAVFSIRYVPTGRGPPE